MHIKLFKKLVIVLLLAMAETPAFANNSYQTIIESNTPSIIESLNSAAQQQQIYAKPIGDVVEWTALQLLDKPYARALLDQRTPEYLYVSLNDTDCMLFVEEVLATSQLIKNKKLDGANLAKQTKLLRYHGNVAYCMRNHYFKDWALENIEKGYVVDEAYALTKVDFPYPANVMSIHLKTVASDIHKNDLACISKREIAINKEHLGFIPLATLPKYLTLIHSGDIIGIVRTPSGAADAVHHLGIAYVHDGKVSMIHASSTFNKVVVADTLLGYLNQFKNSEGIILLRPVKHTN